MQEPEIRHDYKDSQTGQEARAQIDARLPLPPRLLDRARLTPGTILRLKPRAQGEIIEFLTLLPATPAAYNQDCPKALLVYDSNRKNEKIHRIFPYRFVGLFPTQNHTNAQLLLQWHADIKIDGRHPLVLMNIPNPAHDPAWAPDTRQFRADLFIRNMGFHCLRLADGRLSGLALQFPRAHRPPAAGAPPMKSAPLNWRAIPFLKALESSQNNEPRAPRPNPGAAQYQTGDRVNITVTRVTTYGMFATIEGKTGQEPAPEPRPSALIHISELSWGHGNPEDHRPGNRLEAEIISITGGQIAASLKRLKPNPWAGAPARYPTGIIVEGTVIKTLDYMATVQIEPEILGVLHRKNLAPPPGQPSEEKPDLAKIFTPGDKIRVAVVNVNPEKRQMELKQVIMKF